MKSQFGERMRGAALIGSPNTIRKRLAEIEAAGVQELIIAFVHRTISNRSGSSPTSLLHDVTSFPFLLREIETATDRVIPSRESRLS